MRESYAINQGYIFALRCGVLGSSSPTRDEFKWFDSNGNEGKKRYFYFICAYNMMKKLKLIIFYSSKFNQVH